MVKKGSTLICLATFILWLANTFMAALMVVS